MSTREVPNHSRFLFHLDIATTGDPEEQSIGCGILIKADKALRAQLEAVTRERDELRSKLKGTLLVLEPHALDTPMTDLSKILDAHDKAMGEK